MLKSEKGYTLVEILMISVMIGVIITIIYVIIRPAEIYEDGRTAHAKESLRAIANAAMIYAEENDSYPPDVARNLPEEFIQYLSPGAWPNGPFPGSVYDWDNWSGSTCWDGSTGIIQITLRQINDYKGMSDYTMYYVIEGLGIPHCSTSTTKGECVNCESRYP